MTRVYRGYTLIELIVAVGLFAIVMTMAAGAYLVMIGANRQAQALSTGMNNIGFVMEEMARSIRTGTEYSSGCGVSSFTFKDQDGRLTTYTLSAGRIMKGSAPLTAPSVTVTRLRFCAIGTDPAPTDTMQARVHIFIGGSVATGPGRIQAFDFETAATMRGSDLCPHPAPTNGS
jgi:prepilin-type N-terminal cleavage/methylation domain-containing protein